MILKKDEILKNKPLGGLRPRDGESEVIVCPGNEPEMLHGKERCAELIPRYFKRNDNGKFVHIQRVKVLIGNKRSRGLSGSWKDLVGIRDILPHPFRVGINLLKTEAVRVVHGKRFSKAVVQAVFLVVGWFIGLFVIFSILQQTDGKRES